MVTGHMEAQEALQQAQREETDKQLADAAASTERAGEHMQRAVDELNEEVEQVRCRSCLTAFGRTYNGRM